MPLAVQCPECRYQFRVPDHVAGQRGKCPKCKATFLATAATESRGAATAKTVAATSDAKPVNGEAETTAAKTRTQSIPKPRLLEKIATPAAPEEPVTPKLKRAAAIDSPAETAKGDAVKKTASSSEPPPPPAAAPARGAPPKAASTKVPAADDSPAIQLGGSSKASESGAAKVYTHRRPKKSKLPLIVGGLVVLLLALGAIGAGVAMSMLGHDPLAALRPTTGDGDDKSVSPTNSSDGDQEHAPADDGNLPPIDAQLAGWEALRPAIVAINVISAAGGTRSATGFLLPNNLVVTHVEPLDDAQAAVVTLSDNRRFEAASVLTRPQHGLALLKLDGVDALLPKLALRESTPAAGATIFIGDELGATPTRLLRRANVSALAAALRPALPEPLRDNDEIELIEHQARTAKTPDGRTYDTAGGAPLLDEEGRVIGMNLALGGDSRKGYAVAVEQLTGLIAASVTEEFRPLRVGDVASVDPPLPDPTNPFDPPPAVDGSLAAELAKFTAERDALAAKNWRPTSAAEYLAIAAFAHKLTELTAKIDMLEPAQQEAPRAALKTVIEQLADANAKWPTEKEIADINLLAVADLPSGDSPGVFTYARCVMRPEDDALRDKEIDGLPLFLFELPGTQGLVLLPIGENGGDIANGSEWLLLGTKDLTQSVQFTPSEPGAAPRTASIVRAKFILGRRTAPAVEPADPM